MYNITAKQIGTDLVLEYWETPEPIIDNYKTIMNENTNFQHHYNIWLSSKKTVKVRPDFVDKVKNALISMRADGDISYWGVNDDAIKEGVMCQTLKDRIQIVDGYAILKPIESDEETQDRFTIQDMRQAFEFGVNTLSIYRSKKLEKENRVFDKWLESKFTIKRKGE